MPTRTAFVITIGDIIESRPPRRKRQTTSSTIASKSIVDISPTSSSPASSISGISDQDARPLSVRHRSAITMKTRTLVSSSTTGSGFSNGSLPNGCNGVRRGRLLSADQVYGSHGPLSPRTRSGIKQEIDDEVSFVDPLTDEFDLLDEKLSNGDSNCAYNKKKRRSVHEKFLEDNSEYYGFQVLNSKLRSSGEQPLSTSNSTSSSSSVFPNNSSVSIWRQFLHEAKDGERRNRQRHKSASHVDAVVDSTMNGNESHQPSSKLMLRRARTTSSSSANHESKKHLRVSVEKIKMDKKSLVPAYSDDSESDDGDEEGSTTPRKSTRKSSVASTALSPSSRKRRSELDKLLEAGSSSFHFETARETFTRLNGNELGPIHIDVDDSSNSCAPPPISIKLKKEVVDAVVISDSDHEEVVEPSAKKTKMKVKVAATAVKTSDRLLQSADSAVLATVPKQKRGNTESTHPKQKKVKGVKGRRAGRPSKSGPKQARSQAAEDVGPEVERQLSIEQYLPSDLFEELDARLSEVDGSEADVEAMEFSFERTPFRESWFSTYSRQDQGEEILYYPEPKSFPLPYEMPISTFYPRKDGPGGKLNKLGNRKRKLLDTEGTSSTLQSLAPSGTATPTEEEPESAAPEDDPWARAPPVPMPKPLTRGKRGRPADAQLLANALKRTRALGVLENSELLSKLGPKAVMALREFSRKSPRAHASTRSLISAGETTEQTDSADDVDGLIDIESVDATTKTTPAHLLDECSNDSTTSRFSHFSLSASKWDPSSVATDLDPMALDEFLRMTDPDLADGGEISACTSPVPPADSADGRPASVDGHLRKKSKQRRSADRRHHHHKHHRRSKDPNSTVPMDDPMDRLVALNVDQVLLDCLEEELPSVTFDGELPGSEPLELVDNYSLCDAMQLCTSRKTRPRPFLRTPSTSSSSTLDAKDSKTFEEPISPRRTAVLNRLMSSSPNRKLKVATSPRADDTVAKDEDVDSSSEYTSACETLSVASSTHESGNVQQRQNKNKVRGTKNPNKNNSSPLRNSGKGQLLQTVPKVTLKIPPITVKGRIKLVTAKGGKRIKQQQRIVPGKKGRVLLAVARKTPKGKSPSRGPKNRSPNRVQQKGRKSVQKYESEDDDEDEDESGTEDSHEVFQLPPSASSPKNLKLIVRKKRNPSLPLQPRQATTIKIRKPLRVPNRRKKVVVGAVGDSDNSSEDVESDEEFDSDATDEPVRESQRLKTKKKVKTTRRRRR